MKLIKYLAVVFSMAILYWAIPNSCFAQDPGFPDSIIIDSIFVPFNPGQNTICHVPVYFVTDDSVEFIEMRIHWQSPDAQIFMMSPPSWNYPFTEWDHLSDSLDNTGCTLSLLLLADIGGDVNPFLITYYQRLNGFELNFTITGEAGPQIIHLDSVGNITIACNPFGFSPCFKRGYINYGIEDDIDNVHSLSFKYFLKQNYPNPFNSQTIISFELKEPSHANLDIFDITGAKIATLVDGGLAAGKHNIIWDAGSYPSGVYFYRLSAGEYNRTEKMLLVN